MKDHLDQIKATIMELRNIDNKKITGKLDLNKCERVAKKMDSLSENCQECEQQLLELKNHLIQLKLNIDNLDKQALKQHHLLIQKSYNHLQKKHKLLPEGYYMSIYMSIGMSLGVVFGLTIFDNIALGIPIGMCLGIAIGTGLDADVKKKGKTI
ncbi:hypothetical protein [Metabacillus halosaccharovorans]|uniref:hypothetical protein n=1 Tax=Metabacillus halosaccharovorans TaxID=930124 RepID=UPI00204262C3|nr:hypothetical protein [Metabacillus halosaccharovorans]MCM3439448.1 hypothetical protein [Metabacillus halosaccharovorans]